MRFKRYISAFAVAWLLGCSYDIPISISNQSNQELRDVTISGRGFRQHVSLIPAGETKTLYVDPKGETGVAIAFNLGKKRFSYDEDGYFESDDYEVAIIVDAAGRASVNGNVGSLFPRIFGRW